MKKKINNNENNIDSKIIINSNNFDDDNIETVGKNETVDKNIYILKFLIFLN